MCFTSELTFPDSSFLAYLSTKASIAAFDEGEITVFERILIFPLLLEMEDNLSVISLSTVDQVVWLFSLSGPLSLALLYKFKN